MEGRRERVKVQQIATQRQGKEREGKEEQRAGRARIGEEEESVRDSKIFMGSYEQSETNENKQHEENERGAGEVDEDEDREGEVVEGGKESPGRARGSKTARSQGRGRYSSGRSMSGPLDRSLAPSTFLQVEASLESWTRKRVSEGSSESSEVGGRTGRLGVRKKRWKRKRDVASERE
eukprot:766987-Hanusia_phi.AAC.5